MRRRALGSRRDVTVREIEGGRVKPPINYALTCHVDQLDAEGFGREDIQRYVAWKRGTLRPAPDDDEVRRFGQLALLVILTDTT